MSPASSSMPRPQILAELEASRRRNAESAERLNLFNSLLREADIAEVVDLASAISMYEDAFRFCCDSGFGVGHRRACWERLWVLYRKAGRLRDERDMLVDAVTQLSAKAAPATLVRRYSDRLSKVDALIAKSQTPGF